MRLLAMDTPCTYTLFSRLSPRIRKSERESSETGRFGDYIENQLAVVMDARTSKAAVGWSHRRRDQLLRPHQLEGRAGNIAGPRF
jgi:hypothetical protein